MAPIGKVNLSRNGVDVEWRIEDFFSFTDTLNGYFSPDFSLGGQEWGIRIYPNGGWSGGQPTGYIELIFIRRFTGRPIMQHISLSIKTVTGEKDHEHSEKLFEGWGKRGFGHKFLQFVSRTELLSRRSELVPNGVLTIVCSMEQTESAESSSETCTPGSSINPLEKRVLHDFKELFLRKEDCDVTIKVKGSAFPTHKLILKARSPVFASTFRHDMKENATGVVEIEDCDASTFSDFLCFLYCGDVGMISQENVFGLFTAADKYEVLDLRAKCLEFIKKNLTVDTFCETIALALQHSETELIKLSTDYFTKNAPKIIVTVKWQSFLAENPTESNELLVKLLVSNSSSSN